MEFDCANRILFQLKSAFPKWLRVFIIAFVAVLAAHFIFVGEKNVCTAVVNFNYAGLESGFDPNGNRFDQMEMKSAELIRQAVAALDKSVTEEDAERIRNAIEIQGVISKDAFDNVIGKKSIYGGKQLEQVMEVEEMAYFPSQYSITLHYRQAGFSSGQEAAQFLGELLKAYERSFYDKYGYNAALQESVAAIDYEAYDYVNAMDILQNRLSSLNAYLARLAEADNTRFVSETTGYSFADLIGAIDTLQNEDARWITSYIISKNITKDRQNLMDYYQYKIEDAERTLEQQEARLYTLNDLIETYVKTNAVFPGAGSERENASAVYEFSQPSETYDSLINQKVSCQTEISATQEQIALLTRRIERLQDDASSGDSAIVETRLTAMNEKINRLFQDIELTADDFFRNVSLKRAFQTLAEPTSRGWSIASAVRGALSDILIVEAALFGVYVLFSLRAALVKKPDAPQEDESRKVTASA